MSRPIPRDPRTLQTTPEDVDRKIAEILGAAAPTLADEAEQLEKAHDVLRDALQEN